MIEVEARLLYWTAQGMRATVPAPGGEGYIERREVERLLEEAHARGKRQGEQLEHYRLTCRVLG